MLFTRYAPPLVGTAAHTYPGYEQASKQALQQEITGSKQIAQASKHNSSCSKVNGRLKSSTMKKQEGLKQGQNSQLRLQLQLFESGVKFET